MVVVVVLAAVVVVCISHNPVEPLAIYFFNFHRFGSAGGGGGGGVGSSGVGGGRSISWDDPLLTDRFWCLLKRRNGPTDLWMDT